MQADIQYYNENDIEQFLKIISEPNRFKILQLIASEELCVCKIYEALHLPQNLASHHLKVLGELNLVKVRSDKNWKYYKADKQLVKEYLKMVKDDLLSAERKKINYEC